MVCYSQNVLKMRAFIYLNNFISCLPVYLTYLYSVAGIVPGARYMGILKRRVQFSAGSTNILCKGPESKYVRLCEPRGKWRILGRYLYNHSKCNQFNSPAIQKQVLGQIWLYAKVCQSLSGERQA